MSDTQYQYGWKPQLPDFRDHVYTMPMGAAPGAFPKKVDLRPHDSVIYNQYQTSSCTGNSIAAMVEFVRRKEGLVDFVPSRLFIYWNGRSYSQTTDQDCGAVIRDVIKGTAEFGICPESDWKFDQSKVTTKPTDNCFVDAKKDLVLEYSAIPDGDLDHMKACLVEGYPFVFGFSVYDNMESQEMADSGILKMPARDEKFLGGHAVMAVGYDDDNNCIIVRNSWGEDWGMSGYFHMPYDYITHPGLASDFWTIRKVA